MSGTVVFIPAWNEERSLPGVLAEAHGTLPDADLLVIDDGSTDATAELALLADPYVCEAPEVEALVRVTDAKLRLVEVPVHMRQREHGESSFHGKRAVKLVVTIALTLFAGELLRRHHRRRQAPSGLARVLPWRG